MHPYPPRLIWERIKKVVWSNIIPVLEHGKLHVGSGRVSELNIMITIAISPRASLGP